MSTDRDQSAGSESTPAPSPVEVVLGYLNFSDGTRDPQFFAAMNRLFAEVFGATGSPAAYHDAPAAEHDATATEPAPWSPLVRRLQDAIPVLQARGGAFSDVGRAQAALAGVFDGLIPAYLDFHKDLLGYGHATSLCSPFLLARFCEAVLQARAEDEEASQQATVRAALAKVNDYVGYRPTAVLAGNRATKPYAHEFVCPIPLYVQGAGTACGRYHDLMERAVQILATIDESLREQFYFQIENLEEIALDPRGLDQEHPACFRPNYQFGLWDPHSLNERGCYRRLILHDQPLEIALRWATRADPTEGTDPWFEAAAVLAGTMLMGAAVWGPYPGALMSTTNLSELLARIAKARDDFYLRLLPSRGETYGSALASEIVARGRPFDAVRQFLNTTLAEYRSSQVHASGLARIMAQLGAVDAAKTASARLRSSTAAVRADIVIRLGAAESHLRQKQLRDCLTELNESVRMIRSAVECGALGDPWNVLGLGGRFPIFEWSLEGPIDPRLTLLIYLMDKLFQLFASLRRHAAAADAGAIEDEAKRRMEETAEWWDRFATAEVSDLDGFRGQDVCDAAQQVAEVIHAWREERKAAGDTAFWKRHVSRIRSTDSLALLVDTLLDQNDREAAMALLVYWIGRANELGLHGTLNSFAALAYRWFRPLWLADDPAVGDRRKRWFEVRKFLDYLEANAGSLWEVPSLKELLGATAAGSADNSAAIEPQHEDSLWQAAYEGVVFRDSADDGVDGILEDAGEPLENFELSRAFEELRRRIGFLFTVLILRELAAAAFSSLQYDDPEVSEVFIEWHRHVFRIEESLLRLAEDLRGYPLGDPGATPQRLAEYDNRRKLRDTLAERVALAAIQAGDTRRFLAAALPEALHPSVASRRENDWAWEEDFVVLLRTLLHHQLESLESAWADFLIGMRQCKLLYTPVWRGGRPRQYVGRKSLYRCLATATAMVLRRGLVGPALNALSLLREAEKQSAGQGGQVSEMELVIRTLTESVAQSLLTAGRDADLDETVGGTRRPGLFQSLWWAASRLQRAWPELTAEIYISIVETVGSAKEWEHITRFIRTYGGEIFTQEFLDYEHLRGIALTGAGRFLQELDRSGNRPEWRLLRDIRQGKISLVQAAKNLQFIAEIILENYAEYADYNSLTTQSDYGENLHCLLDFLALKERFTRMEWNLTPYLVFYDQLLQKGLWSLADRWEKGVVEETAATVSELQEAYSQLSRHHGIRLLVLEETLRDGFRGILLRRRMAALAHKAVHLQDAGRRHESLDKLWHAIEEYGVRHTVMGASAPSWLLELEDHLNRASQFGDEIEGGWLQLLEANGAGPRHVLSAEEILAGLDAWEIGKRRSRRR
ncbi:MAG: hypothetical protein GYA33_13350 [Thermogutta sp.]|nr:hypothetical protein [Thermogutta sp.]